MVDGTMNGRHQLLQLSARLNVFHNVFLIFPTTLLHILIVFLNFGFYPANATLVCVLLDIKSVHIFSFYLSRDGSLWRCSDRREILHDRKAVLDVASPLLVAIALGVSKCGVKKKRGVSFSACKKPFDHKYLENGESQRYTSIRA